MTGNRQFGAYFKGTFTINGMKKINITKLNGCYITTMPSLTSYENVGEKAVPPGDNQIRFGAVHGTDEGASGANCSGTI